MVFFTVVLALFLRWAVCLLLRVLRVYACITAFQVLMHNLRPELPAALGPRMHALLQRMWGTAPGHRPDLAVVLDELDAADAAGPDEAFASSGARLAAGDEDRGGDDAAAIRDAGDGGGDHDVSP
jgi:hypothetical protein